MQIFGILLLTAVIWYGFTERDATVISAFDQHAFVMVLFGSLASMFVSSSAMTAWRTLLCLREIVPGASTLAPANAALEEERAQLVQLWREGRRAAAVELAEASRFEAIRRMLALVLERAPDKAIEGGFTEERHAELLRWQPAIANWELLAKLAPSFGMIGTITGMIQLFRSMGADDFNIGAAMSLALLSTLYGVAFGAGVAGPVGHLLRGLLDERLGALDRCEQSTGELIARSSRLAAG